MRNIVVGVALGLFVAVGAFASETGQPLSFEDWVLLDATYSLEPIQPLSRLIDNANTSYAMDASGAYWTAARTASLGLCGYGNWPHYNTEILRCTADLVTCAVVARIEDRCHSCVDAVEPSAIWIDSTLGHLYVRYYSYMRGNCPGYGVLSVLRVIGLPTEFEVLQTYSRSTTSLSFRVPYMPEGMGGAEHFDTYWGNLSTVGDWSQAHGLQCGYPVTPPQRGDYMSVADTLPTPSPGSGYYYVTSATYQGQTRYGRKTTAGRQSGRDPALLPACGQ